MEERIFDGMLESEIDWEGTYDLNVYMLKRLGFDVIEEEGKENYHSHDYIYFLMEVESRLSRLLGTASPLSTRP